jgi:hypothetical protein
MAAEFNTQAEKFKTNPEFLERPESLRRRVLEKMTLPVFTMSERRQVTSELGAFWDAWLDVARGPERLTPFIADSCLHHYRGDGPCDSEMLEIFDELAFDTWDCIESFDCGSYTENFRNEWREAGLFDPQHLALVRPYLGRHLKEGAIWKFPAFLKGLEVGSDVFDHPDCENLATQEERIGCYEAWLSLLPAEGFQYLVITEPAMLVFGREGTSLQLVGMLVF